MSRRKRLLVLPPKFPHVKIDLKDSGHETTAFWIISMVRNAMRRAGVSDADIAQFTEEAKDVSYDRLLRVVLAYVEVQ